MSARSRQRGFMLIVAVVLIVVGAILAASISFMAVSSHQSASNQATGKQALFLAESGLERAIQRFSDGTSCDASLVETVTNPFGQGGSFQVVSASTVGALCRIRVQGSLDSADRIVEADVSKGLLEDFNYPDPTTSEDFLDIWTVTQENGAGGVGGHSTQYGNAPGSTGGHVFASSDPTGDNDRFRYTVERSLNGASFIAQAGVPIAVDFFWRKSRTASVSARDHLLELSVRSSSGGPTQVLFSDNQTQSGILDVWHSESISVAPAGGIVGRLVDTLILRFDMREENEPGNPDLLVAGGFDFIQFGGGTSVAAWREIYP